MPVFKVGNLSVSAGGAFKGAKPQPGQVVLDLADEVSDHRVKVSGPLARGLKKTRDYGGLDLTVVKIDWKDYGTPNLGYDFWDALVEDLLTLAEEKPVDVLVMCQGGHGRTGTALSILATLLGLVPDGMCPVKWVRTNYCQEAVESDKQLQYIQDMTGVPVTSGGSKSYSKTTTYYSGTSGTTGGSNPAKGGGKSLLSDEEKQEAAALGMSEEDYLAMIDADEDDVEVEGDSPKDKAALESEQFWSEYEDPYGNWRNGWFRD